MNQAREQLVATCIKGFFEMLNAHDLEGVMRGIADDCEMRIPSSNFTYTGKAALRDHLEDFIQSFPSIHFRDFVTAADPHENRVAIRFNISLIDDEGEETHMSNCNFFEIREDGQIEDILIFASAPLSKGFEVGNNQ
ncbi:MAG: nuclear transport factor 2 family protein [Parasphingorhabdus sp.]|uniref:nuclear transport factor 2 family protein n=1 Tax=Parasphingorhabdus sp. TaxID=2709688 RepID=UPI003298BC98